MTDEEILNRRIAALERDNERLRKLIKRLSLITLSCDMIQFIFSSFIVENDVRASYYNILLQKAVNITGFLYKSSLYVILERYIIQ